MKTHLILICKVSNSLIYLEQSDLGFTNSLTINGIYTKNITFDAGNSLLRFDQITSLTINNLWVTDMSLSTDTTKWIIVYGLDTQIAINGLYMHNLS